MCINNSQFCFVRRSQKAFTLAEVMIATVTMAIMFLAVFSGISYGFTESQLSRENLRATQIILERMEGIRLYTFDQLTSSNMFPTRFTAEYNPFAETNQSHGVTYYGKFSIADPKTGTDYNADIRLITVSVSWTNSCGIGGNAPHYLEMQTMVGRNGIQNYTFFN